MKTLKEKLKDTIMRYEKKLVRLQKRIDFLESKEYGKIIEQETRKQTAKEILDILKLNRHCFSCFEFWDKIEQKYLKELNRK